MTCNFIL
ncbi:hypothetical protein AB3S75_035073 [Citrus x aurantiifolia]